jgi:hypothetical protein
MRYSLRYKNHDLDLPEGEFIIGRAATAQLSLDDPMVSRDHARLRVQMEAVSIEDLRSRNGVRVNGDLIQKEQELSPGDQIVIGSQEMVLLLRREPTADTLVQPVPQRGNRFGLLGILAEKALGLGRGEEAERLIAQQLDQLLTDLRAGRQTSADNIEWAADFALRLAQATGSGRWVDFLLGLYTALQRACPAVLVDELYVLMRRVQNPPREPLRAYLKVLRELELGPADRFLVSRLEGLERLISVR